jgi:hypothetical protein
VVGGGGRERKRERKRERENVAPQKIKEHFYRCTQVKCLELKGKLVLTESVAASKV